MNGQLINTKSDPIFLYLFAAYALVRAELTGQVPERFTGNGPQRWAQFANELSQADLLDLAIRDAAVAYPIPFGMRADVPGSWNERSVLDAESAQILIQDALAAADLPSEEYLQRQANRLNIKLPSQTALASLPTPEPHHEILELPGTGAMLAYHILQHHNGGVYLWENFYITCATWQETALAGLIAFELNAPPQRALPIVQDESLRSLFEADKRFDWVIGSKEANAHRALEPLAHQEERIILV